MGVPIDSEPIDNVPIDIYRRNKNLVLDETTSEVSVNNI